MSKPKKEQESKPDEFIPFGPEWETAVMKCPKVFIVRMLRNALLANKFLESALSDASDGRLP